MTKSRMLMYLDLTLDILQRVQSNICRSNIDRKMRMDMSEDIQEIEKLIFLVNKKLKECKFNDR